MRGLFSAAALIVSLLPGISLASSNGTSLSSRHILPSTFTPPAVFENVNLVRTINLERCYPRETINVAIRNIASEPQEYYYLPFEGDIVGRIGGVEARDKRREDAPPFEVQQIEYDPYSSTQFYRIALPQPLEPKAEQTITITFQTISANRPLPAKIAQNDKQYLSYDFSAYFPSAYTTLKQKTKLRFLSDDVTDYTTLAAPSTKGVQSENNEDPVREGKSYTYGPFTNVPAGAIEAANVRYEFTKPLMHVSLLERDVEISHWGGNLATEERYMLTNRAAGLTGYFNRVMYQQAAYYNPPSVAMKQIWVPLLPSAVNPYYIDDVGNISTSNFRLGDGKNKAATLDLRPRYPIFGDWNFKFRIGWDRPLSDALRKVRTSDTYVLSVPFLEGPREGEGTEYAKVVSKIILPEGATNVQFSTDVHLVSSEISTMRTFMDTHGRTTLTLTAMNLIEDTRMKAIHVTYDYPFTAAFRKPLTITSACLSIFVVAWLVSMADVRITSRKS